MTKRLDWRQQAALLGVEASGGHPIESLAIAKNKYQLLIGRELYLSEIHMLEDAIYKLIKEKWASNNN